MNFVFSALTVAADLVLQDQCYTQCIRVYVSENQISPEIKLKDQSGIEQRPLSHYQRTH